jgi:hypothetical protein
VPVTVCTRRLLTFVGTLTFDLSYLSAVLCEYEFSFFDTLFFTTLALALGVISVPVYWALCRRSNGFPDTTFLKGLYHGVFATLHTTVHILIFAFPVSNAPN